MKKEPKMKLVKLEGGPASGESLWIAPTDLIKIPVKPGYQVDLGVRALAYKFKEETNDYYLYTYMGNLK